eukprot:TRINITY_DN12470_c0_g1_i4.p1 TRINITY_DN12470_c0_g1~~TRINITY_DN12470_c0_g1_i4.p1  ORF type:complete len:129 (-),score=12.50 TRINITY_DN12470_c0_g1_i4:134-520(-)
MCIRDRAIADADIDYMPAINFGVDTFPHIIIILPNGTTIIIPLTINVSTMMDYMRTHISALENCNAEAENKGMEAVAEKRKDSLPENVKEEYYVAREYGKYVAGLVVLLALAFLLIIRSAAKKLRAVS